MDRAHRIGQKKEVQVFRFCTEGSIEEKVCFAHAVSLPAFLLFVWSACILVQITLRSQLLFRTSRQ